MDHPLAAYATCFPEDRSYTPKLYGGNRSRSFALRTEAAFALAERITGVRLTPELFESLEITCALVTVP
ncbi:DUF6461 domain-containing protein [Streptomyces sp. NPDC046759]|uniref:DUF6461 domain-containing protein n=1 Tax=Streptomyces sp. NPDC046759 TaxID=3155019 RepID=UPI00340B92E1